MEGFKLPVHTNFVEDRTGKWWLRRSPVWQCTVCGTPGITDRTSHNQFQRCRPVAWLDPLGVLVETVFALWGPNAEVSVKPVLPQIPAGKTIKIKDLPYFTKLDAFDTTAEWLVVGHKEFMTPGTLIAVNRRADDATEVYVEEWRYIRESPRTGNTHVMATFRRAGED
jgi:hypothetical protein